MNTSLAMTPPEVVGVLQDGVYSVNQYIQRVLCGLTDGMDEWGSKRAGIVKIFLCTRAAISQLVCGSLPHNLRLLV